MNQPLKVCLKYLGCRLNEAELQSWAQQFSDHGMLVVNDPKDVDLIILNSCAVTLEAARKSRQNIRKFHRQSPMAKLVVTGCYASLEADKVAEIMGVDLVISNQQKDQLVKTVMQKLAFNTAPVAATEPGESVIFKRHRQRAFIKIQDGCRWRCTYCIVTVARGEEVSRSIDEIVNEVNNLHSQGILEIVLTGVHVGGFGTDIGTSLYQLVIALLENTKIPRIRFASVEPWDLPDDFFSLFENPRVMPHMHLPIQSGSDSVLKRMARRCKTEQFSKLLEVARSHVPHFNVTTDIIVGFPGETEQEWQQTLEFVQNQNFGSIHIFSYSSREGTKAARLSGAIEASVKKSRSKQLHQLSAVQKKLCLESHQPSIQPILLEADFEKLDQKLFQYRGYTPNYHRVVLRTNQPNLGGAIVEVKISAIDHSEGQFETQYLRTITTPKKQALIQIQPSYA